MITATSGLPNFNELVFAVKGDEITNELYDFIRDFNIAVVGRKSKQWYYSK